MRIFLDICRPQKMENRIVRSTRLLTYQARFIPSVRSAIGPDVYVLI